jgi:hypothetical protein
LIATVVGAYLRHRLFVNVTAQRAVDPGPSVMYDGSPNPGPSDVMLFTVTNRSLRDPVFVRKVGAVGRGIASDEVFVNCWLGPSPRRLERNEGESWILSFNALADGGIDLRKGVRGWAIIHGRERPFRSRKLNIGPTGNRGIPMPPPRARPSI